MSGWQKLCEGTRGLCRKGWIRTKSLSPNIYLVAILRFDAINTLFWRIWAFMVAKVFLGQEVHYNMVYSVYFSELDWKICNSAQK